MRHALPVLVPALMLGACAPAGAELPAPPQGSSGWIRLGETASIGPDVRPLNVIEDSRCPADAVCMWAGTIKVNTHLSWAGGAQQRIATLALNEPVQVADGALTLIEVIPALKSGETISAADYRFAFSFDGGM